MDLWPFQGRTAPRKRMKMGFEDLGRMKLDAAFLMGHVVDRTATFAFKSDDRDYYQTGISQ
jgi:hypothetical protein